MIFETVVGGPIRNLVVSSIGDFFIFAGNNRLMRKFAQTKEQVFAIETKEQMKDNDIMEEYVLKEDNTLQRDQVVKKLEELKESEDLMNTIEELEAEDSQLQRDYETNLILQKRVELPKFKNREGKNPAETLFIKLSKVRGGQVNPLLSFLHTSHIRSLIHFLEHATLKGINQHLSITIFKHIIQHRKSVYQSDDVLKNSLKRSSDVLIRSLLHSSEDVTNNLCCLSIYTREAKLLR